MTTPSSSRSATLLILTCLLLSGLCGLIYEVLWLRMLTLVLGNTLLSITTVLVAFMTGLGLGSFLAGRFEHRVRHPLRAYALLEAAIGLYALLLPLLLAAAQPLFRIVYQNLEASTFSSSLVRFLICALLLLLPTTLMGATLPVLCKHFADQRRSSGWTVGVLYGTNTLGAALGALAAGFLLIPILGVRWTVIGAALGNFLVAGCVLALHRKQALTTEASEPAQPATIELETPTGAAPARSRQTLAALIAIALSGVAAMIYQVAWTRALSLSIGSTVYSFSLILTVFICGLALGSLLIPKLIDSARDLTLRLAVVMATIGLSGLMTAVVLGKLPLYMARLASSFADSFRLLILTELGLIFLLLLLPTFMMGAAIPLATAICTSDARRLGRFFGDTYSVNTLGAIAGSLLAGFVLIPWVGIRGSILCAATINLGVAALILLPLARTGGRATRAVASLIALGLIVLAWRTLPAWDPFVQTSGPYMYADLYEDLSTRMELGLEGAMREGRQLLFYEEGENAVVSVKRTAHGDLALEVNGKTDATARGDASTQLMAGQLPLLLHDDPQRVLVIGLGSGMTLGAVERHPVQQIDVVELEPAVARASRLFTEYTGEVLEDPRLRLILADGRTHLAYTDRSYDVIISEPTNIWISGVANLFSREFFELVTQRLNPGGVVCQWLHAYSMSSDDFKTVVRTFAGVFPHISIWEADLANDYLLIGSLDEPRIDLDRLARRLSDAALLPDLERMNVTDELSLLGKLLISGEAIGRFAGDGPINTDDNALLEHSTPRGLVQSRSTLLLEELARHRSTVRELMRLLDGDAAARIEPALTRRFDAQTEVMAGFVSYARGAAEDAEAAFSRALALDPAVHDAAYLLARLHCERGRAADDAERPAEAEQAYRACSRVVDEYIAVTGGRLARQFDLATLQSEAQLHLGVMHLKTGATGAAERALRASLAGGVQLVQAHNNLGVIYEGAGRLDEAAEQYRLALAVNPGHSSSRMNLGTIYLKQKDYPAAIESYLQLRKTRPDDAVLHYNLGVAYFQQNEWESASREWSRALELDPALSAAEKGLALARERLSAR